MNNVPFGSPFGSELYFFRDSHGQEVDLLIRDQGRLQAIEIKSAATFSESFLNGIARISDLLGDRYAGGTVLYNGDREFTVQGVRIVNPLQCENFSWFAPREAGR